MFEFLSDGTTENLKHSIKILPIFADQSSGDFFMKKSIGFIRNAGVDIYDHASFDSLLQETKTNSTELIKKVFRDSNLIIDSLLSNDLDFALIESMDSYYGSNHSVSEELSSYSYEVIDRKRLEIPLSLVSSGTGLLDNQKVIFCTRLGFYHFQKIITKKFNDYEIIFLEYQDVLKEKNGLKILFNKDLSEEDKEIYSNNEISYFKEFDLITNVKLAKKSFLTKALGYHNNEKFIHIIILAGAGITYLVYDYFKLDLIEVVFESAAILATIILFVLSDKFKNYSASKVLGGYWKYSIKPYGDPKYSDPSNIRLVKIMYTDDEVIIHGWKAGKPRKRLFESTKTFFSNPHERKGMLIYNYISSGDLTSIKSFFGGFVFLEYCLENSDDKITKMNGRYISKFSLNEGDNPDSGAIRYQRISKTEFEQLLKTPVDITNQSDSSSQNVLDFKKSA